MTAHAAMHRAYAAWRRTQAQLELVLDEAPASLPGGLVERVLTPGAEPCRDLTTATDGMASRVAAPLALSRGSAPPHTRPPREV